MILSFDLRFPALRLLLMAATLIILGFLARSVILEFVVGSLSYEKVETDKNILSAALKYKPNSGKLFAKLADTEFRGSEKNLAEAEISAAEAVKFSPNNYKYHLLLASIREARGNQARAEQSLKEALTAAPNYSEVHWQLANLLVRTGRINEAIEEFRAAVQINPNLVPATLDLVWTVSKENFEVLKSIVRDNPQSELKLASFLAARSRITEAAEIFTKIDNSVVVASPETSQFLEILVNNRFPGIANELWGKMMTSKSPNADSTKIWNGDFETIRASEQPSQFDWQINKSDYARITIVNNWGRSGNHSLLIDFKGRDTTRLDNEIRHLLVLKPGAVYELEGFVKTENLQTSEGPRLVLSDKSGKQLAASAPVLTGNSDWKQIVISFTAPQKGDDDATTVFLSIKRQPRYSFDEPTQGRIWFDDFSLSEVK